MADIYNVKLRTYTLSAQLQEKGSGGGRVLGNTLITIAMPRADDDRPGKNLAHTGGPSSSCRCGA